MTTRTEASIHETAAQRALQVTELLEIILGHTILPGINSARPETRERAWKATTVACRAVCRLWKGVCNDLLRAVFMPNAVVESSNVPAAFLRILASDQSMAATVTDYTDNIRCIGYTAALNWSLAAHASSESVTELAFNLRTLGAISAIRCVCPYVRFPNLHCCCLLLSVSTPYVNEFSLGQMRAFIASLPITAGASCNLEADLCAQQSPPLLWHSFEVARTLVAHLRAF